MNEVEALEQIKGMLEIKENFSISDSVRKDTRYNLLKEVEALKVAFDRLEKHIPKKVVTVGIFERTFCPNCSARLVLEVDYCTHCGQRIDWS